MKIPIPPLVEVWWLMREDFIFRAYFQKRWTISFCLAFFFEGMFVPVFLVGFASESPHAIIFGLFCFSTYSSQLCWCFLTSHVMSCNFAFHYYYIHFFSFPHSRPWTNSEEYNID